MIEFDAVRPVGARTSSDFPAKLGGVSHEWLEEDVEGYASEHARLRSNSLHPQLSKREHLDALGAFESMKKKASKGQLEVGFTSAFSARVMMRVDYIIELRPRLAGGAHPARLARLYYAEPRAVDGALLPLVIDTKPSGKDVDREQNESIDTAKARSRTWTLYKNSEGGRK